MKVRSLTLLIVVGLMALFACLPAVAQPTSGDGNSDYFSNLGKSGFSLLDPSRISMSNSYTFSYFSGNGYSGSVGMLMNSIEYRVSNPLTVTFNLGVLHNPSALVSRTQGGISPRFMPGFQLRYRPGDNFLFQMDFQYRQLYPFGLYDSPRLYDHSRDLFDR